MSDQIPQPSTNLLRQVWLGMGRLDLLNPKLLITLTVMLFVTDLLYEGQQHPEVLPRLLWVSPLLILVFIFTLIPFTWLLRRLQKESIRAVLLLSVVMIGAGLKSFLFMYFLHPATYLEKFQDRAAGDLTIAGIYVVTAAVIINAYEYHAKVVQELNRVSARLEEQKQVRVEVAQDVEKGLQEKASSALMNELDKISDSSASILGSTELAALKLQIESLIRNQVRPLSRDLLGRVKLLQTKTVETMKPSRFGDVLNMKFNPRHDASYVASFVISIPNILLTTASQVSFAASMLLLAVSATYPLIGRLLQRVMPHRNGSGPWALTLTAMGSAIAYVPTGIYLAWLSGSSPGVTFTVYSAFGLLLFTGLAGTAWFALQRNRNEKAAEITRINSEIRHELELLDQAIWVAKRKWSYIIHGTVQGALTVASSRLEMATRYDERLKATVRQDIERAKAVLQNPPSFDRPARELLDEIAATWAGVCEFEYLLAPSAELAISKNTISNTCLIEITKELISNANRHGGATKFWLNAHLDPQGDLSIVAGNNGKTLARSSTGGLGQEMITQLTRNWKIDGSGYRSFSATLPLARN